MAKADLGGDWAQLNAAVPRLVQTYAALAEAEIAAAEAAVKDKDEAWKIRDGEKAEVAWQTPQKTGPSKTPSC